MKHPSGDRSSVTNRFNRNSIYFRQTAHTSDSTVCNRTLYEMTRVMGKIHAMICFMGALYGFFAKLEMMGGV
jgi:hypothetical protein